ncbi:MAG: T9SS type A sorting domain-containing protein [Bacteroidetes bacterium]|nr:T9SS type A sorting domain-containing protein [Bacteroidota bacterium]
MKKIFSFLMMVVFTGLSWGQTLVGSGQTYTTLKSAFDAINNGTITGAVVLQLTSSTTETASAVLNASGGTASYTSVSIYPTGSGYSISGSIAGALIDLNGADNVTIDGRVNQSGNKNLSIINNDAGSLASTIRFINDATNNVIKYTTIKGSTTSNTCGVVYFTTSTAVLGNDNNLLNYCDVCDGTTKPRYLISSNGTTSLDNSGNTISNCNLYNFDGSSNAAGIYISTASTNWTISGNSIYQTTAYAGSASSNSYGIYITSGDNYNINSNFIGGSSPNCGNTAWTVNGTAATYKFGGMYLNLGITNTSAIQNNIIRNFNWLTSATATATPGIWNAIYLITGNVNITGNMIGDSVGTGSVFITSAATTVGAYCYGITTATTAGITNISNNILGSITVTGSTVSALSALYLIHTSGGSSVTVNNNLVGSLTTPSSINLANPATTTTNQFINCIYNNAPGTAIITNNTVANIYNNYKANGTNAANICGIFIGGGSNTISGNTIRDLSSTGTTAGTGIGSCITGIFVRDNSLVTGNQVISQNTIYNISNSAATAAINLAGIIFDAYSNASSNIIERNKIYNLSLATSGAGVISGIYSSSNGTSTTYKNNMIALGTNLTNGYTIYGLMDSTGTNNYYNNSVFIDGTAVTGTAATYAFNSLVTSNSRNFIDNIFYNARSNSGSGTGKHYAVKVAGTSVNPAGLTINYNDYYVTGTGGVLGYFNSADVANLTAWKTAVGQDVNSFNADPLFISNNDLHIQTTTPSPVDNSGISVATVTDDFDGQTRSITPDIGADEFTGTPTTSCSGMPASSTITGSAAICSGTSTLLSLSTVYNLLGIKYQWKSSSTSGGPYINMDTLSTQATGNITSTKYYICAISCSNSGLVFTTPEKTVVVTTPPSATISYAGSPYCNSVTTAQSVTLTGTSGGIFSAAPTGLSLNASTGAVTPSTSTAGGYNVSYTIAAAGGCATLTATTSVNITLPSTATIAYAGSPYCKSLTTAQPVTLTGSGGGIYSASASGLTINATTGAITPGTSTAATYTVTYTIAAAGGCAAFSTTTSVTIAAAPSATINYTGTPFCNNVTTAQSVSLTGSTGGNFSALPAGLTINATTGAVTPSSSSAGSYTVSYIIPASGGCAAFSTTTPVYINPLPAAAGTITSVNNDSVTTGESNLLYKVPQIANATSYSWSYTGNGATFIPSSTTTGDSVRISFSAAATSGNLTVKGHNACGDGAVSAVYHIYVAVGINDIVNTLNFRIYPNPNKGKLTVEMSGINTSFDIQLIDLQGKVIYNEKITKPEQAYSHTIDLSSYNKGIYFIKLSNKNFSKVEKIVIQ